MGIAKVYMPQGADRIVVDDGGLLEVRAGGAIQAAAGATIALGSALSIGGALNLAQGSPVNAAAAAGTLTFTDAVTDGELVVIGDSTYEFDTDTSVTGGHLAVDVSASQAAADAITALLAAIAADTTSVVTAAKGTGTKVVVTAKVVGAAANAVATTTTCAAATWAKATLEGGANGTVGAKGDVYVDASYLYVASADNTTTDANWRRIALGAVY